MHGLQGLTISGLKSAIGMPGIEIVGVVCDYNGRQTRGKESAEDTGLANSAQTQTEHEDLLESCVYYRIFIHGFSIIAAPIYLLFRKGKVFSGGPERQSAMDQVEIMYYGSSDSHFTRFLSLGSTDNSSLRRFYDYRMGCIM